MKRQIVLFLCFILMVFFLSSVAYGQDDSESAWDELYESQQTQEDTGHKDDIYELGERELDEAEKEMETKDEIPETPAKYEGDIYRSGVTSESNGGELTKDSQGRIDSEGTIHGFDKTGQGRVDSEGNIRGYDNTYKGRVDEEGHIHGYGGEDEGRIQQE